MALDAAHRASIYEKLRPVLGDDDANMLMSEFPSLEAHELVTKDFLRAELALTKGELRSEIGELRSELRSEIGELRSELRSEIGELRSELRSEIGGLRSELRSEIAGLRGEIAGAKTSMLLWLGSAIAASTALQIAAMGLLS